MSCRSFKTKHTKSEPTHTSKNLKHHTIEQDGVTHHDEQGSSLDSNKISILKNNHTDLEKQHIKCTSLKKNPMQSSSLDCE